MKSSCKGIPFSLPCHPFFLIQRSMSNRPHPMWYWLRNVLLLAVVYFVTGKLGLLLAVPPGYATAVWPPSGIALVGLLLLGPRHWPGVTLGSFCVNVGLSFDASSTVAITKSLAIAFSIALGAGMQGVAGVWLLRRFIGWPRMPFISLPPARCTRNTYSMRLRSATCWNACSSPSPSETAGNWKRGRCLPITIISSRAVSMIRETWVKFSMICMASLRAS